MAQLLTFRISAFNLWANVIFIEPSPLLPLSDYWVEFLWNANNDDIGDPSIF